MKKAIIFWAFIFYFLIGVPSVFAAPNCTNLSGPSTIILGSSGTYMANFSSSQGNLRLDISAHVPGGSYADANSWAWNRWGDGIRYPGGTSANNVSYTWTPVATGTYTVFCRAWDDGIAECEGDPNFVDGPPRYACAGPNSTMSVTVSTGGPPGVVQYGSTLEKGAGEVSSKNWRAKTTNSVFNNYKVAGYWDKIIDGKSPAGIDSSTNIAVTAAGNYYKAAGDLLINKVQTITEAGSAIILVPGNLTITKQIKRNKKKAFVAFFVKGNIILETDLAGTANNPAVDGVFYADGTINVPVTDKQLFANGIFIALQGFTLSRSLGNNDNTGNPKLPAEVFSFDPSLVINAPADLMRSSYNWKEVAP